MQFLTLIVFFCCCMHQVLSGGYTPACTLSTPLASCSCINNGGCKVSNSKCISGKCACRAGYFLQNNQCKKGKVGSDCTSPHSGLACEKLTFVTCASNRCSCFAGAVTLTPNHGCICPAGKIRNSQRNGCVPAKIGDDCTGVNRRACSGLNAVCQNRKCKCTGGKVANSDNTLCIKPTPVCGSGKTLSPNKNSCVQAKLGSNCEGPFNPQACANIAFSQCISGKCQCKNSFEASGNTKCICPVAKTLKNGSCVAAKVNDSCAAPVSARACQNLANTACFLNKCKCKYGFTLVGQICKHIHG